MKSIHSSFVFAFIFFCFLPIVSLAQQTDTKSDPEIVKIDREVLSGLNIPRFKLPNAPDREYYQQRLYGGSDLSVFVLSSATADNKIESFPIEEYVYYIQGKADINLASKEHLQFLGGDHLFVPKGFKGVWRNSGGNRLHLELSVISTKRSKKGVSSEPKKPFLLDRLKLSGIGLTKISKNEFRDTLYKGPELEIFTHAEKATSTTIERQPQDELIHILSGKVELKSKSGIRSVFFAGDFFVIPKGFKGTWKSVGKPFRTLRVKSTSSRDKVS